jgi:alpha-galactosidase
VRHLNAEKRAIIANEEIIAIDQDPLFHAGELVRNNSDGSQIWHRV